MQKWENVTSEVVIDLTDEMRDELGLFDDAQKLYLSVKHSGYYDECNPFGNPETATPPESDCEVHTIEGDIQSEDYESNPLSAEQIEIILDGGDTFNAIYQKL